MNLTRTRDPGLGTVVVHGVAMFVLVLMLAPLIVLRVGVCGLGELLIHATDGLQDALADRLNR